MLKIAYINKNRTAGLLGSELLEEIDIGHLRFNGSANEYVIRLSQKIITIQLNTAVCSSIPS